MSTNGGNKPAGGDALLTPPEPSLEGGPRTEATTSFFSKLRVLSPAYILRRPVLLTTIAAAGISGFEILKQTISPHLTLWRIPTS